MNESGSGRRNESGKRELEIDSPEIIFGVDNNFGEHIGSLEEACNTDDLDAIADLLGSNNFVENIVIRKGDKKKYLGLLETAVNTLTQAEIGKDITAVLDIADLERVIKAGKLPPFTAAELACAYFHLNKDDESEQLANLITKARLLTEDVVARANAFNTLGCIYLRQDAVKASIEAHKAGLNLLPPEEQRSANMHWQASKLRYGIIIDRMTDVVSVDAPEKLFAERRKREQLKDTFNIGRVDLDVARAFARLKKRDQAIHYAEQARDLMGQVGYLSGSEQAGQLLEKLKRKK